MNAAPPLLHIGRLDAGYGALQILFGIDLTVSAGEHVLVFGANGAGKSTLIKTVAGLLTPTAGRIDFAGARLDARPPEAIAAAGIGYVPQVANVFPSLTVTENLEIGGVLLSARQRRARLDDVCTVFPRLGERRRQTAGTLSGGERQMLAIARALMPEPPLLLLDEPSAGVAPTVVTRLFALVASLRTTGTAVLMVEQNAKQALAHVDRGVVLESGRVRLTGPAATLLDNPEIGRLYLGSTEAQERNDLTPNAQIGDRS